ncbi:hypothetical protein L2U69_00715 [Zavarzinia compransoris]|uniref:hypothetical protein n=1 Tax=Zavarzinia marina TaxID=2911065 RepID=UPI001F3D6AF0|nr:hypothetical protein [Zavarzinia marina]MCF4164164.1 hypothetical protein [Zavarzinia marina]
MNFPSIGRAAVAAAVLGLCAGAPARAADIEGRWTLDLEATLKAASETVGPDDIKRMRNDLSAMASGFAMTFAGKALEVVAGDTVTRCDWAMGKDGYVLPSNCLDQAGKENDLDPEREAIRIERGVVRLIDKPSGLALILQRD